MSNRVEGNIVHDNDGTDWEYYTKTGEPVGIDEIPQGDDYIAVQTDPSSGEILGAEVGTMNLPPNLSLDDLLKP